MKNLKLKVAAITFAFVGLFAFSAQSNGLILPSCDDNNRPQDSCESNPTVQCCIYQDGGPQIQLGEFIVP